jgi:hypothetical protein
MRAIAEAVAEKLRVMIKLRVVAADQSRDEDHLSQRVSGGVSRLPYSPHG